MKILICMIVTFCTACRLPKVTRISQTNNAEWLVGTWENKSSRGRMYETWRKISNTELLGKSYILRDQDTLVFENIQLTRINNVLTYIPTVNGQNNNQPVRFPLITSSGNKMVFENKTHDFPQLISYTRISKDSLVAEISGISKGVARRQTIPMKRIK